MDESRNSDLGLLQCMLMEIQFCSGDSFLRCENFVCISLLPDRKLKYLNQQPLSTLADSKEGSALLLHWYFEDCLKRRYRLCFLGASKSFFSKCWDHNLFTFNCCRSVRSEIMVDDFLRLLQV